MFECCNNCGHRNHQEICFEITFNKKCPCVEYIPQIFNSFDEVYQEYEKLLFILEKDKSMHSNPKKLRKHIHQRISMSSKIRILKKWIDKNKK